MAPDPSPLDKLKHDFDQLQRLFEHANEPKKQQMGEALSRFRREVANANLDTDSNFIFQGWIAILMLQLAVIGGVVITSYGHIGDSWNIVFLAMGAVALGFGAAVLLYQRLGVRQTGGLEMHYRLLRERAHLLVQELDLIERDNRPESKANAG